MYTRCTHCHAALGANEDIESFTVGRRLAFDAAKGRLWVICPACMRWNLTPLEERWEAIEGCERLYRTTRQRFSTDEIGLARLRSGVDLIRVGRPLRPEFAAWRYGDRFGRRRRRFLVRSAAASAASGAGWLTFQFGLVNLPAMLVVGAASVVAGEIQRRYHMARERQVLARVASSDGVSLALTRGDLQRLDLAREATDRWTLELPGRRERTLLVDGAALHVGALALAELNAAGGSVGQVQAAVKKLEWFDGPDGLRRFAVRQGGLQKLGYEQRLAIEMALHEEAERRALEGELGELERMWREAEELAAIADNLFLPAGVTEWIKRHQSRREADGSRDAAG